MPKKMEYPKGGSAINEGLIEKSPISVNPVHDRKPPNFIPPSSTPKNVTHGKTTFKVK